jgi:hypothetical protein
MAANREWPAYNLRQLLARLPAEAQARYRAFGALIDDLTALNAAADERGKVMRDELARLTDSAARKRDDVDERASLEAQIEVLQSELETLARDRSTREALKANTLQCKSAVEQWLANLEMGAVSVAGPLRPVRVEPRLSKGESVKDALLRVRRDIAGIKHELAQVAAAPLPPDEIKAEIVRQVEALAAQGRPRLNLENGKVALSFPDMPAFGTGALTTPSGAVSQWLCWLFGDLVVERLCVGVDGIENGLRQEERETRSVELETKLLKLEHEEEALVVLALSERLEVHRRLGASVMALLGLEAAPEPVSVQAAE